jgi:hypothetical protein
VQHVLEPSPCLHRRVSSRGRAAAAARRRLPRPILLHQSFTGESIDDPRSLFTCPCFTSPPASLPSPSGPKGGTKGIFVKDLKVLGSFVHKDCSLFCGLVQQLVKSIKNHRKIQKQQLNFFVLSVTRTTTFSKYVYTFEF